MVQPAVEMLVHVIPMAQIMKAVQMVQPAVEMVVHVIPTAQVVLKAVGL